MSATEGDRADTTADDEQIAEAVTRAGLSVAAAESLTGGSISARLSAIEGASEWFAGAVVAYSAEVKFRVLDVDRGPVITSATAEQMATGVRRLLDTDIAVSTTGVGGPGPQEGQPQGTVHIGVATANGSVVSEYHFDGDPPQIVEQATEQALHDLLEAVRSLIP